MSAAAAGGEDPRAGEAAVVRGLASLALAAAERGATEDEARIDLIRVLRAHGTADPALVARAADAVTSLVEPDDERPDLDRGGPDEDPDEEDLGGMDPAEARRVREALGLVPVEEQLAAAITAREWLQRFAADLAR